MDSADDESTRPVEDIKRLERRVEELAIELAGMTKLHDLRCRLLGERDSRQILEQVLDATIALQHSDFGAVQLYDPESQLLELVAQSGFPQDFLYNFRPLENQEKTGAWAARAVQRVLIEDVDADPAFQPYRALGASAGFRALQSTPFLSRSGEPLGIISTHFRQPHRPSERELRLTDLYALLAAQLIERNRIEAALHRSEAQMAQGQRMSQTGSCVWNSITGELSWSSEHCRIFGVEPTSKKISFEGFLQIVHPEDRAYVEETIKASAHKATPFAIDYRIVCPNGLTRDIHSIGQPTAEKPGIGEFIVTVMDVTEHKHAEDEVRKLAALVENSGDFIGISAPNGEVLFVNAAGQKAVGLGGPEQIRQAQIKDFVVTEDQHIMEEQILPSVFAQGAWQGEIRFRHFQTGAAIPMLSNVFFIREKGDGRRVALATISRDITERKRAEIALTEAKEQAEQRAREAEQAQSILQTLLENANEGITLTGGPPDFPIIANSKHAAKLIGFEPSSLLNVPAGFHAPLYGILRPGTLELPRPEELPLYRASRHGEVIENEERVLERADGTHIDVLANVAPIRDFRGRVIGAINCWRDITERRKAEERLRRSEAYLAEGQKLSHTASWAWNVETGEIFWSQELFRIYGIDPETAKPGYPSVLSYIHPQDRDRARQVFESAVQDKKEYELAYRVMWQDGTIRHVNNIAHPVFDRNGKLVEYVGTTIDTTERISAEERLREYEKAVENLDEMIVVVDREYRYRLANRAFLTYRGFEREQLEGRRVPELMDESVWDVAKEKLDEALAGKVVKYELTNEYPNIGKRDLFISYFPVEGVNGIDRVVCVVQDITERKQAEAKVRRSEANLAEGERISHTGSWTWNVVTGECFWSLEHFRIFGLDPETFSPTKGNSQALIHPEDLPRVQQILDEAIRNESDFEVEYRLNHPDGSIRYHRGLGRPITKVGGDLYFTGSVIDITEQKHAEESLRKAHESLELILSSISDQFFGLNKEYRFTYLNRHAATQMRRLGKDPERLIGKVLWDEFPEVPNEANIRRVIAERVAVTDELYYDPLGEWVENHMYPSPDGGLVTVQRYITGRKSAEEELHKTREELAHVTRLTTLGELAASIAHEINQPLGAIVNNSNACVRLFRQPGTKEEIRATLADIVQDASRASAIITRIRALVKKSIPEKIPLAIASVIADVLALTHHSLTERRIKIQTDLPRRLPRILGDRVQLQQVFLNLVVNAADAVADLGDDRRLITIKVHSAQLDEGTPAVLIAVTDLGHGFEPGNAEKLFEAFYTTKPKGMGMGLRISRSIVNAHGGRLWVACNEGPGATFFCAVPSE